MQPTCWCAERVQRTVPCLWRTEPSEGVVGTSQLLACTRAAPPIYIFEPEFQISQAGLKLATELGKDPRASDPPAQVLGLQTGATVPALCQGSNSGLCACSEQGLYQLCHVLALAGVSKEQLQYPEPSGSCWHLVNPKTYPAEFLWSFEKIEGKGGKAPGFFTVGSWRDS